ncbi:MAG: hypothetical protein ACJ766_02195, partial [Thermoleophilaceae bacterium]
MTSLPEAPGLRFWFEAAGLHQAAQLYVELRTMTGCPVRVRPGATGAENPAALGRRRRDTTDGRGPV